jgi:hypothetical protein
MADPVSEHKQPEPAPLARRPAQQDVPRHRFGIAYLALAAILGAAVGLFVVLTGNGGKNSGPAWSAWKPTETGVQRLDQIATYVSGAYALPAGSKLAGAIEAPPVVEEQGQSVPLRTIGVGRGLPGESVNDLDYYDAASAWTFQLCGLGPNCTLLGGQPSTEKGQLLRREALELALYTFKYNGGIDSLLTFMPPSEKAKPSKVVLFFRRTDLKSLLDKPLALTLPPPRTRLIPGAMSANDLTTVRALADPRLYNYEFGQTSLGTAIIVLKPPAA